MKRIIILFVIFLLLIFSMASILNTSSIEFNDGPTIVKIIVKKEYSSAEGTGFFIEDNLVMTAGHCLIDVNSITVVWEGGCSQLASFWCFPNKYYDVGLIYIDTNNIELPAIFSNPVVGENVLVEGNPVGLFPYITKGIISKISDDIVFTDASVNPGNSGSPVLNSKNEVVGLITRAYFYLDGLGMAIHPDRCMEVVEKYKIFIDGNLEDLAKYYIGN